MRNIEAQQRGLAHIHTEMPRIKPRVQLRTDIAHRWVQLDFLYLKHGLAPDHLHRLRQLFPYHRRAKNVVTINHRLYRGQITVQTISACKAHLAPKKIRVSLRTHQMMEKNPLLQRSKRIDLLHIHGTSRNRCHHSVDLFLTQIDQRKHHWRDTFATCRHAVRRYRDFECAPPHRHRKLREYRRCKQRPHIQPESCPSHALDQAHGQQRVSSQREEVVSATHTLNAKNLTPD